MERVFTVGQTVYAAFMNATYEIAVTVVRVNKHTVRIRHTDGREISVRPNQLSARPTGLPSHAEWKRMVYAAFMNENYETAVTVWKRGI